MKTVDQLEAEIREAEQEAASLAATARESRSLPFYGSGKARRIATAGAGSTAALQKAYRLRQLLPAGHPMRWEDEAA